jgi:hypothetical protein
VFARPRRLDPEKHRIAEEEFLALEKAGIIRCSNSPWASPLHLVPKKDGSWRPCGDYRCLNAVTIPDRYPLPNMQSLNESIARCTVFSKIDLVKAYHQIPIAEEDIPKMAIATPFGLWEFLFMAFSLRNAAQALQRLKDNILMGLDYVFSFLDDDGVFSKSREQHWTQLRTLFAILAANGLALNLEKSMFAVSELDFLGHRISATGVAPLRDNVQVILDFPKPTDCKAMQRFLGMVNFYCRFLPSVTGTLRPLTAALSGNSKVLPWTPDMETAFAAAKAALVAAVPLGHPLSGAVLALATDASDTHVRGVLQQQVGQHWQPLGFFSYMSCSKKLSKTKVNYSTFNRELLAAVSGVKHFRSRLEGRPIQLWTDHKPASSATWHSFQNTPTTLCMYQVRLTWRTHCPNRRWPLPGPPRSAQPSPTGRPWISRIWPSAKSSAHRYKLSVPTRGCASSHRRSATLTSSATHPQALSARWCPGTFDDRFSNISTGRRSWPAGDPPPHLL